MKHQKHPPKKTMSDIEKIPGVLLTQVTSYLPARDAIFFQNSSPQLRNTIGLEMRSIRLPNFHEIGRYHTGDRVRRKFALSCEDAAVHSSKLSFVYEDQGWGNRKGIVYVSELNSLSENDTENIIARSPVAEHSSGRWELVFKPKKGFFYGVCYSVGGGGGHTLSVRNISVRSFVYKQEEETGAGQGSSGSPNPRSEARGLCLMTSSGKQVHEWEEEEVAAAEYRRRRAIRTRR